VDPISLISTHRIGMFGQLLEAANLDSN